MSKVRIASLLVGLYLVGSMLGCATAGAPAGAPGEARGSEVRSGPLLGPPDIARILRENGYRAEVRVDSDGVRRHIVSGAQGLEFRVRFARCQAGVDCSVVYFTSGFDLEDGEISLSRINAWNQDHFAQGLLDEDGDPWIDFTVQMGGGLPEENFAEIVRLYEGQLATFARYIGFWESDAPAEAQQPWSGSDSDGWPSAPFQEL